MVILRTYDKFKPLIEKFFIWAWILLIIWRRTPGQYMGCVVQLTGLSHNDYHFLSQWSLFKSNNYAQKIPTSGRKLFCLSINFGYHLAVGPPLGSRLWWLKKNPDFVQKQKKILPSAHFGLFLPSGPTVLAHFWLLSAHWTTVDHEHGHCVLEKWNKTVRDQFLGRRIQLQGQKGNFRKNPFFFQ
jgi:hypothetical protein